MSIVVAFDPQKTSPNKRSHWGVRYRLNREARKAATAGWLHAGCPRFPGKVRVTITVYRGRKVDPDNLLASCKALNDQLFSGLVTPNDSDEWVEYAPVRQVTGARWSGRAACVEFQIEEAE